MPSRTGTTAPPATRSALTGQNIGDRLNAARPLVGLVRGRVPPQHQLRRLRWRPPANTGQSDQPRSGRTSSSDCGLREAGCRTPRTRECATPCIRSAWRSGRHRAMGLQGRLHPAPRAVPVLRSHGEPAPSDDPDRLERERHARRTGGRSARDTQSYATACRSSTRRTTSTTSVTSISWWPRSRTASCRPRRCLRSASSRPGLPGRPRLLLRPRRRAAVPRRARSMHSRRLPDWREHRGDHPVRRLRRLV